MSFIRTNDNLPRPQIFESHAGSDILNRVVKRPLVGLGRDGRMLEMRGFSGTYASRGGQPVPLGVVSNTYEIVQMSDLCAAAERVMQDAFTPGQLASVEIRDSSAGNGAWVRRQYVVKAFEEALTYGNATARTIDVGTTVAATCSITTSYDGGSSTQLDIGTLDLVCQNGMTALSSMDWFRKRHTKTATVEVFEDWLTDLAPRFAAQVETMRAWSDTGLTWTEIEETIRALPSVSDKKAEKLLDRAARECADRGFNVYALTSAFTFYSSHNSEEFPIRQTGNDNVATTLSDRGVEVSRWVGSAPFQALLAA